MKPCDKIALLKELLSDKDMISKEILGEEPESEGELIVSAEGDSPEDAKDKIVEELESSELPDEEDMEDIMPEEEMEEGEEELDLDMLDDEDREILDMLPERSREEFKLKLLEKIKNM